MGYIQCEPLSQRTKREEVEEEGERRGRGRVGRGGEATELALSFSGKALSLEPQTPWQNHFSGVPAVIFLGVGEWKHPAFSSPEIRVRAL